jgi:histidyl-tRNA synthetase
VVERGTHAKLVAAGGRYEELYRTQFDDASVQVPLQVAGG